jgi:type IV fimbrial biogenesis protein FimT
MRRSIPSDCTLSRLNATDFHLRSGLCGASQFVRRPPERAVRSSGRTYRSPVSTVKSRPPVTILRCMKKSAGFTIIELMITIVVLGIALAFAVPNMQQFIMSNRLTSQLNLLASNLALARNEAVKQNARVVICATTDGESCEEEGVAWDDGWIVFVDRDADLTPDELDDDACEEGATEGDCLLINQSALSGPNVLTPGAGIPGLLSYDGSGAAFCSVDAGDANTPCASADTFFTLCDPRGAAHARALAISNTGRTSILTKAPNGDALSCGE